MEQYSNYQEQVLDACKKLVDRGILKATGGNISARVLGEDKIAITPSNKDYTSIAPEDICILDYDGNQLAGKYLPSIEHGFHMEIYKNRMDVGGIVHTHQPYATIFSLINSSVPALFDEQVFHLGENIALVKYAASGTDKLAENIVDSIRNGNNAYILENHGALLLGGTVDEAALNSMVVEKTAQAYVGALGTDKKVWKLPADSVQMFADMMKERQANYRKTHSEAYKN